MTLKKYLITAILATLSFSPLRAESTDSFYKQVTCLATNIYFEARGEPIKGQIAVAMVTINRVADNDFPDTICEVVYQGSPTRGRCQFSWYCDGKADKIPKHSPEKRIAMLVATLVLTTPIKDPTNGALYFNTSNKATNAIKIGAHTFY